MTITLQDITPGKIKPHPKNPRGDVGDVSELAASIREQGILEPLLVVPNGPTSTFVLIAGHRRLAAAKEVKCKTVPCIVREDVTDPGRQLEMALVENLQRVDLTPIEEATGYQQLLEFPGYTIPKIAKATGRSQATVKGRLAISQLPERARSAVRTGQLNLADALAITEFAKDTAAVNRLTKAVGTSNFKWELENARRKKAAAALTAKTRKALAAAGTKILAKPPHWKEKFSWLDQADLDQHTDCGGLAAVIQQSGTASYVCLNPDAHQNSDEADIDAGGADESPEDAARRAEAEKARAEREQLHDDLKVAAAVRRAHLADVIASGADSPIAHETLLRLVTYSASTATPFAMEILGLDYDPDAAAEDNDAKLKARLAALNVNQLAVTLDVLLNANPDGDLEQPVGWGNGFGDSCKGWRHRLGTVYGYEWSQVELEQLEKHPDDQGPLTAEEAEESDSYEHSDLCDAIDEFEDIDA